jgi:hypothetical protein
MKTLEKIELIGEIQGEIWMPYETCAKEFHKVYTPNDRPFSRKWNGLRDALLDITNDGDFRSCSISDIFGYAYYNQGKAQIRLPLEINPAAKAISDLFIQ